MNNRKTGMIFSYTETFLGMVSGLFLSSFLLRVLGDFEYGLYQTMSAFINYLVILEFGTGTVMCRHLLLADDDRKRKRIISTLWYLTIALSIFIILVSLVFYCNIHKIYANTIPKEQMDYARIIFAVMLVYLIVSFFSHTMSGVFLGNRNYNVGSVIRIARHIIRTIILAITVVMIKYSVIIAICDVVIGIVILIFEILYAKRKYKVSFHARDFDKAVLKDSVPLCVALLLQAIINQANSNVDKFIISVKMNMESVSLYSVAMYIFTMFSSITTKPITMYMPQVADNIKKGLRGKELTGTLVQSGRLVAIIGGMILFGFAVVGKQFIEIVYGEVYTDAWMISLVLLIPTFVNMTGGNIVNVLDVLNKRQIRSYMLLVTTILNVILTVVFINFFGILGAAVATATSLFLGQVILLNIYYYKALSINAWKFYLDSYKGILPAEITAAIIAFVSCYFIENKYTSLIVGGIVYIIAACVFLMLFGLYDSEKKQVKRLLKKVKIG